MIKSAITISMIENLFDSFKITDIEVFIAESVKIHHAVPLMLLVNVP